MPCEPFFNKGKMVGFMCGMVLDKTKSPPCYKCGKPSTKLCDHRDMYQHYERDDYGNIVRKVWYPSMCTCDRPMCDSCANHIDPDTDFCDFHNSEIAKIRSEKAEHLYQKRILREGLEW